MISTPFLGRLIKGVINERLLWVAKDTRLLISTIINENIFFLYNELFCYTKWPNIKMTAMLELCFSNGNH